MRLDYSDCSSPWLTPPPSSRSVLSPPPLSSLQLLQTPPCPPLHCSRHLPRLQRSVWSGCDPAATLSRLTFTPCSIVLTRIKHSGGGMTRGRMWSAALALCPLVTADKPSTTVPGALMLNASFFSFSFWKGRECRIPPSLVFESCLFFRLGTFTHTNTPSPLHSFTHFFTHTHTLSLSLCLSVSLCVLHT